MTALRFSARETVTVEHEAMWYKRRLMQRAQAGMAKLTPRIIREAGGLHEHQVKAIGSKQLTDIAPYRCPVDSVPIPNDGVHELIEAPNAHPEHVQASTCVPCLQMPGEGTCAGEETQERAGRVDLLREW